MSRMSEPRPKSFDISKRAVWDAYRRVKANRGGAGIDGQSMTEFEENLQRNLYRLWNRLSSGSYFPPPVATQSVTCKSTWDTPGVRPVLSGPTQGPGDGAITNQFWDGNRC